MKLVLERNGNAVQGSDHLTVGSIVIVETFRRVQRFVQAQIKDAVVLSSLYEFVGTSR